MFERNYDLMHYFYLCKYMHEIIPIVYVTKLTKLKCLIYGKDSNLFILGERTYTHPRFDVFPKSPL